MSFPPLNIHPYLRLLRYWKLTNQRRCFTTRRRRRQGLSPVYGTGWMPFSGNKSNGAYPQNGAGYYNSNQPYNGGAAPPYSPPVENQQTSNTFNSNEGYYGGHQGGYGQNVELQPPQNAYYPQRGGDTVYEAPQGAPTGKGNHIIQ
jgi:Chitin synthesis regulation, resistance to Congo red